MSITYGPSAYSEPTVVARVLAILPAAGAWDPDPVEFSVAGYDAMMLYLTYEPEADDNAFDWQVQYSPYSADVAGVLSWFSETAEQVAAVVVGTTTIDNVQTAYESYEEEAVADQGIAYGPILLHKLGAERCRIVARESGVVGDPGALGILVKLSQGEA